MLTQEKLGKLLNRSLTTAEDSNFTLYLNIATQRLEELLCMDLTSDDGERTYETRTGYRTLYIDPFTELTTVTVDGVAIESTNYTLKQNDRLNAGWYNIIEFEDVQTGKLAVVDADWGFDSCPVDLELLLARLFALVSKEQTTDDRVKSKKIEDYSVTYKDVTTFEELVLSNRSIIDKYSYCNQGYIRHGYVQPVYYI